MKKTSSARRIGVAEAKAELSRELKSAASAPTVIHNRGRDVAVLIGVEEYERLAALDRGASPMASFIEDVEKLKTRWEAVDFEPERISYSPRDPFRSTKRRK